MSTQTDRRFDIADARAFLKFLIAGTLLAASLLKFTALFVNVDSSPRKLFLPLPLVYASVVTEFALGMWLLGGSFSLRKWISCALLFSLFAGISLYQALSGIKVCDCFGYLAVSPWMTFSLDLAVLLSLAFSVPIESSGRPAFQQSRLRIVITCATVALATLISAASLSSGILAQIDNMPAWRTRDKSMSKGDFVWPSVEPNLRAILSPIGIQPRQAGAPRVRIDTIDEYLHKILRSYAVENNASALRVDLATFAGLNTLGVFGSPYVIKTKSGQVHVVLGKFLDEGDLYLHVSSTAGTQHLVPYDIFVASIEEIWQLVSETTAGRPMSATFNFGEARLVVDRLFHSFGMAQPHSNMATHFQFTNSGRTTLQLDASVGCGCLSASFADGHNSLKPGETAKLNVFLDVASSNVRQVVKVAVRDKSATIESEPIALELLAILRETLKTSATTIDFGLVEGTDPVTRLIRLSEVPADRFEIESVDLGELPATWTVAQHRQRNTDLRDFEIEFALSPQKLTPGLHRAKLTVNTTSRHLPKVEVRYSAKSLPHARVVPEILNFGPVTVGKRAQQSATIRLRSTDKCTISAINKTVGQFTLAEVTQITPTEYSLSIEYLGTAPGFDKGEIELQATSPSWSEKVKLTCTAFVMPR